MATVDQLVIELRAKTAQFEQGMDRAGRTTESFSTIAKRAGLFAGVMAAALVATGKKAVEVAGQMQDLAQETGVAASTFSALQVPLQQSGSSIQEFAASIVKMNRAISDAASGDNDKLTATFNELGLSLAKLRTLTPEQQLNAVVTSLAQIKDQGDLTRLGMDIFGRSFSGLIPIIRETNGDLSEYARKQQEAGNALTNEQIEKLDSYGDKLDKLQIQFQNFSAKRFLDVMAAVEAAFIAVGLVTVQAQKNLGIIDSDVANEAIKEGRARIAELNKRDKGDAAGGDGKINAEGANAVTGKGASKTQKDVEKLRDSLNELQRETSRDVYTSGMASLEKKLTEVDFLAKDLAKTYRTDLTPTQEKQIETIKDNIRTFDALQQQQEDSERLANSMGDAFSQAFEDGIKGAESFSDVLDSLLGQIESVLLRQIVTDPLNELVKGVVSQSGVSSLFSDLFSGFRAEGGSVQSGMPYVVGEKRPEIFVPSSGGRIVPNAGGMGGGANVNVNIINNSSAKVSTQSSQNSNGGTDLRLMIDDAVANNVATRGSKTNQALSAFNSQALVRR